MTIKIKKSYWTILDLEDDDTWSYNNEEVFVNYIGSPICGMEISSNGEGKERPYWVEEDSGHTTWAKTGDRYMSWAGFSDIIIGLPLEDYTIYDPDREETWPKVGTECVVMFRVKNIYYDHSVYTCQKYCDCPGLHWEHEDGDSFPIQPGDRWLAYELEEVDG
jgi:hypothetical protein